jgi:two-component system cell cycle response regulator DivK
MAKKVLIIEDSSDISGSLKRLIELEGYEAIVANTAFEGLDKAQTEKPDLILMDLSLPDLSGIDLTRQIRSIDQTSKIPILCVSSYTRGVETEVLEAGCNEIFSKTSFIVSFAPTLKKYLEKEIGSSA